MSRRDSRWADETLTLDCNSTDEQKQSDGQALFDFCAECLGRFIEDHYGDEDGNVDLEENLPLGFTFSYPCL